VSNQHESIGEFAKRLFINGSDLSPLPLRLLDGNLSCEASFIIKCKEIGHQLSLDDYSYPGTSNRLELLLLSGYVFGKIQKDIEPAHSHLSLSDSAMGLLEESIREFFEREVEESSDRFNNHVSLESERKKVIISFIRNIKNKEIS
jgi:hypothetical protein